MEQQLRSAIRISHEEDIKYVPHINEHYPEVLRQSATSFFCTAGSPSREEHPTQHLSIDIPPGILDDAPLAIMLGGIAWFGACIQMPCFRDGDDNHNEEWHERFRLILEDYIETFTECSFPTLPAQGFAFCKELYFDCHKEFACEKPKQVLKIFVAVAIFLTNRNVSLQCCSRCQFLYTQFFSDEALSRNINESSVRVNTDASGIPSQLHPQNCIDIGLLCVSGTSLDHVNKTKESPHIPEDLIGMDAFTNVTLDKSLTKEQLQLQLATKFMSLVSISVVISVSLITSSFRLDTWSQLV